MKTRSKSVLLFVVVCAVGAAVPAQTITEFPVSGRPYDITAGPDGNLWFGASGDRIVRMTPAGVATEFALPPHVDLSVSGVTSGPDGNVWYVRSRSFIDVDDSGRIGRVTPAGGVTEFPLDESLTGITVGPDLNLWFIGAQRSNIYRMATSGQLILPTFQIPGPGWSLRDLARGPDGNVWYTHELANRIGRITSGGVVAEFPVPTPSAGIGSIATGADGNLWFTEYSANKIGRITPSGAITEFPVPTPAAGLAGITAGPDGNVWFTEQLANKIGRITPAGVITEFPIPTPSSEPGGITAGPGDAIWFSELRSAIGRITTGVVVDPERILPVVGSTAGVNGTFFRTSVQLHNPTGATIAGRIVFHPSGVSGSGSDPALSYTLSPGQTQSIPDLLPAMGLSGVGSADIEATSGSIPVSTIRVFNDAGAAGTTGFTEEPIRREAVLGPGTFAVLLVPADSTNFRFNVGLRTLEEGATATLALRDSSGSVVSTVSRVLPAVYHEQQSATMFFGVASLPSGGSIEFEVGLGAAVFYGATVDNRTGDPSLQIARGPWDL